MALLKHYTVYDVKAGAYLPPFQDQSHATAIRRFTELANQPDHPFQKHAEDYTLFYVGDFDDEHAVFDNPTAPLALARALEVQVGAEAEELRLTEGESIEK